MNLFSLLNSLSSDNPIHAVSIPTTWHQGRTAYGGLSTTLAYQAAALAAPDLPPLLSAQIAFAGPVAGDVTIEAKVLRRGRNSAFIRSDIRSGEDIVFSGTFVFMAPRESHVNFSDIAAPDFPSIPDDEGLRSGPPEFFTYHMQYAEKRLIEGNGTSSLSGWYRFREHQGLDPHGEPFMHRRRAAALGDGVDDRARHGEFDQLAGQLAERKAANRQWLVVFAKRNPLRRAWRKQPDYARLEQPG
jgi:hypothetical protein